MWSESRSAILPRRGDYATAPWRYPFDPMEGERADGHTALQAARAFFLKSVGTA